MPRTVSALRTSLTAFSGNRYSEAEMTERVAFIGFGEAGQTLSRGLLGEARPAITEDRAELVRAIREAMGR